MRVYVMTFSPGIGIAGFLVTYSDAIRVGLRGTLFIKAGLVLPWLVGASGSTPQQEIERFAPAFANLSISLRFEGNPIIFNFENTKEILMPFSRRSFLAWSASTPFLSVLPQRAIAEIPIGPGTLTTVSDGHLVLPGSFIFGPMPQDDLGPIIDAYGLSADQLAPECNLALYRDGAIGDLVLVDSRKWCG